MDAELQARRRKLIAAVGAILAAAGVALAAYASHAAAGAAQAPLQQAALFAFAHGVALAALAPLAVRWLAQAALGLLLLGVLLFSGGLLAAHAVGAPTTLVPYGGGLMIAGWLLHAFQQFRR